jgi:hypothetical protein
MGGRGDCTAQAWAAWPHESSRGQQMSDDGDSASTVRRDVQLISELPAGVVVHALAVLLTRTTGSSALRSSSSVPHRSTRKMCGSGWHRQTGSCCSIQGCHAWFKRSSDGEEVEMWRSERATGGVPLLEERSGSGRWKGFLCGLA